MPLRFSTLSQTEAAKAAKARAELQELSNRLAEPEGQNAIAEHLLRLRSPEQLASLVTTNVRGLELEQVGLELRVCAN